LTVELANALVALVDASRGGRLKDEIPGARAAERAIATMQQFHSQVMARRQPVARRPRAGAPRGCGWLNHGAADIIE